MIVQRTPLNVKPSIDFRNDDEDIQTILRFSVEDVKEVQAYSERDEETKKDEYMLRITYSSSEPQDLKD